MGCSTQEKLAQYQGVEITFGSGGGFTGQEVSYTLTYTGKLVKTDKLKNETVELKKLNSGNALNIFEQITELNIAGLDFNHPGNKYYFIRETKKTGEEKVVWGDGQKNPPQAVLDYYKLLMSYVNKK
jgi:hypothetical protein